MPDFEHQLFISYSSLDRRWAQRLSSDLQAKGVNCFWDARLKRGDLWEPQLLGKLKASQHLAVLWSNNAQLSNWVSEELYRFKALIDPDGTGQLRDGRRLFAILLEGENKALARFQTPPTLREAGAYSKQFTDFDVKLQQLWDDTVEEITTVVMEKDPAERVPIAVLSMTTAVLDRAATQGKSPVEVPPGISDALGVFLTNLQIPSVDQLRERYGERPMDWKPFGTELTIEKILDQLLNDDATGVNKRLPGRKLRWQPVDLVNINYASLDDEVRKLRSGLAVLVLDPLSLCNREVLDRYARLKGCFYNEQAVILLLPPFPLQAPFGYLRRYLRYRGAPLLDSYYDPLPADPSYANYIFTATDEAEMNRLIKSVLGKRTALIGAAPTAGSVFTTMGSSPG
jgi:hypothetical protein